MSGRSSRRELRVAATTVAATAAAACATLALGCGKSAAKKPEADPATVKALAATMAGEVPTPAAVPDCTPADLDGGAPLTFRTLMLLGDKKIDPMRPEEAEWINPPALDAPAARTLVAPAASATAARQAAAELLAAPFWVVYKIDNVNAPMALGVKELKIGTIGTRVIRYEKTGHPSCVLVFFFQNDKAVSDDAIAKSDRALMDPEIAQLLRDDLAAQWIKQAPR
jgi:hypothetical protein